MAGWFKWHRRYKECDALGYGENWYLIGAWVAIIDKAAIQPTSFRGIEINRGEFGFTYRSLMDEWKKSPTTIREVLNHFAEHGMIEIRQAGRTCSVIKVCNFDTYQGSSERIRSCSASATENDTQRIRFCSASVSDPVALALQNSATGSDTQNKNIDKEVLKEVLKEEYPPTPQGGLGDVDVVFRCWEQRRTERPELPTATPTERRRALAAERLKNTKWLKWYEAALKLIPLPGDGWQPTLDWLIKSDDNALRIVEGSYEWRGTPSQRAARENRNGFVAKKSAANTTRQRERIRARLVKEHGIRDEVELQRLIDAELSR